ncbi:uncharacterized protein LOC134675519 [Cydia fagiglandana]|uniref:uncharacterized protein LOC134675519 n=1 Tax=Cydia fagiglandana TaxID=1458189 RepID=UPI00212F3722
MPLPFNKSLDLKLLALVKENSILYNTKHPRYLDFDAREVVWQKIGDALNRSDQVCKARWINIRDMMRRKIRERLRNPQHRSYNYKYEEEMSFMIPYFKDSNTSNEEYTDFIEEDTPCDDISPSDVFADVESYQPKESKPVINTMKPKEDFQNQFQDLNPTDPIDVFLITIGSTLRRFSPYYLNQAKSKIFQVVQDYELQQIMNKDDNLNASSSDAR